MWNDLFLILFETFERGDMVSVLKCWGEPFVPAWCSHDRKLQSQLWQDAETCCAQCRNFKQAHVVFPNYAMQAIHHPKRFKQHPQPAHREH